MASAYVHGGIGGEVYIKLPLVIETEIPSGFSLREFRG